jgi:hypothetical protein
MESLAKDALLNAQNNEPLSIVRLQVVASFLMTKFSETPNPKISHLIVRHLHLLIEHPDVAQFPDSRESYLQLQGQWQRTTEMLLRQRESNESTRQSKH